MTNHTITSGTRTINGELFLFNSDGNYVSIERDISVVEIITDPENIGNVTPVYADEITSVDSFCCDRTCKFHQNGMHVKHAKSAKIVTYIPFSPLISSYANVRSKDVLVAYPTTPLKCCICELYLIPTDAENVFCNPCIKKEFSHPHNPGWFIDDTDQRDFMLTCGYYSGQYYNSDCTCRNCWNYRNDEAVDEENIKLYDFPQDKDEMGDLIFDPNDPDSDWGPYQIITGRGNHVNPPDVNTTYGKCMDCSQYAEHLYHKLYERPKSVLL